MNVLAFVLCALLAAFNVGGRASWLGLAVALALTPALIEAAASL